MASHGWSRVRVRQAVRGCALEFNADAAAHGVFDGLLGLGVEAVDPQAATGRSQRVRSVYGSARWRAASRG